MLNDTQSQTRLVCARCGKTVADEPRVRILRATYNQDGYVMALAWHDYHAGCAPAADGSPRP